MPVESAAKSAAKSNVLAQWARPQSGEPADAAFIRRQGCMDVVVAAASLVEGVETQYLASPTRGRASLAQARQRAQYLCHVGFGCTYTEIGARFNRDRTSVAYACQRIEDSREHRQRDHALARLECSLRSLAQSLGLVKDDTPQ